MFKQDNAKTVKHSVEEDFKKLEELLMLGTLMLALGADKSAIKAFTAMMTIIRRNNGDGAPSDATKH